MAAASERSRLPHGARGVKIGDLSIIVANDKVVLSSPGQKHLTVHMGSSSGRLDIHESTTASDGSKTHETLFAITHTSMSVLLQELEAATAGPLLGLLRHLRPGWMVRQQVGAVLGLLPDDGPLADITRAHHQKLTVDAVKLARQIRAPDWIDELYALPPGKPFTLVSYRRATPRIIGIGFTRRDDPDRPRLIWFPLDKLPRLATTMCAALRDLAMKYGEFHRPLPWL